MIHFADRCFITCASFATAQSFLLYKSFDNANMLNIFIVDVSESDDRNTEIYLLVVLLVVHRPVMCLHCSINHTVVLSPWEIRNSRLSQFDAKLWLRHIWVAVCFQHHSMCIYNTKIDTTPQQIPPPTSLLLENTHTGGFGHSDLLPPCTCLRVEQLELWALQ